MHSRLLPNGSVPVLIICTVSVLLGISCSGGNIDELAQRCSAFMATNDLSLRGIEVPVQAVHYDSDTDQGIDGFVLGGGPDSVILSNQVDTDLCSWLPTARRFAEEDRRVLIYDYAGRTPPSKDIEAAANELAGMGVDRVVLVGSSMGALASLAAASSIERPVVSGVASLSAVSSYSGIDAWRAAEKVRTPLLVLTARDDLSAAEVAPERAKASPSKDERVVVLEGSEHGIDLLEGKNGPRARSLLKGFIDRNLPQN